MMTTDQKAAFIIAQSALLNAEIASMQAENHSSATRSGNVPYGEEHNQKVIKQYEGVLGYNAMIDFFRD